MTITNLLIPNIFEQGTTARADKVNENFEEFRDKTNEIVSAVNTNTAAIEAVEQLTEDARNYAAEAEQAAVRAEEQAQRVFEEFDNGLNDIVNIMANLPDVPLFYPLGMPYMLPDNRYASLAGTWESADDKPESFEFIQSRFNAGTVVNDVVQLSNINNNILTATVPCVIAPDGTRIVHIDDMAYLDNLFNITKVAMYFGYDPSASRIRLPRNNKFFSYIDNNSYVNSYNFSSLKSPDSGLFTPYCANSIDTILGECYTDTPQANKNLDIQERNVSLLLYFRTS